MNSPSFALRPFCSDRAGLRFCVDIAGLAINPVRVFRTGLPLHWEFLRLWPVLSSPARGSPSLAMAQRRIKVVFVLWDDLKFTSGLRTSTAFNGQNYFFKIGRSKVLDEYYNSYLKK
jgi:hypothetical protein